MLPRLQLDNGEDEWLHVDAYARHECEIPLRWVNGTEWSGAIKVDQAVLAFGPVEVRD